MHLSELHRHTVTLDKNWTMTYARLNHVRAHLVGLATVLAIVGGGYHVGGFFGDYKSDLSSWGGYLLLQVF